MQSLFGFGDLSGSRAPMPNETHGNAVVEALSFRVEDVEGETELRISKLAASDSAV